MPVEILLDIFKSLDICSSLCLALASPHLYPIYKRENPLIPNLWTPVNSRDPITQHLWHWYSQYSIPLGDYLKTWIGPKYKPLTYTWYSSCRFFVFDLHLLPPYFVLKSAYGSRKKMDSLIYRYHDYWPSEKGCRFLLPHPRNKGHEWWDEARAIMIREAPNFQSYNDWHIFWTSHLCATMSRLTKLEVRDGYIDRMLLEMSPDAEKRGTLKKAAQRYGIYLRMSKIPAKEFAADLSKREACYHPRRRFL